MAEEEMSECVHWWLCDTQDSAGNTAAECKYCPATRTFTNKAAFASWQAGNEGTGRDQIRAALRQDFTDISDPVYASRTYNTLRQS